MGVSAYVIFKLSNQIIIINIQMSQSKHRHYHDEYRSSNINQDSYEQKDRSRDPSERAAERRKIFGFEIFIDNDILDDLGNLDSFFNTVREEGKAERIRFNPDLTIPDLNGRNLQIYDKSMEAKYQCCKILLSHVYQKFKKLKNQSFSIIIFVPEGMVSLLIGTKGHQINKIMKESKTVIVVNQPINRMTYRTVKIQGYHNDIARACRIIYQILEEKSTIAYTIEKEPNPLDYTKSKVTIKMILGTGVINYLQNKKKKFIKLAEDETRCTIRFKEEHNRLLKRDEDMCVVIGRLEDVQAIIILLLTVVSNYYVDEKDGENYTLKMLIPSNYVTKLIGQKGYMIKGITDKSGALIKIQSDKQSETKECIIAIIGSRQNKIDATCFILEQIECFKNGGPILQSGKSINENLAQQFKNSLPLRQFSAEEGERVQLEVQNKEIVDLSSKKHEVVENKAPELILSTSGKKKQGVQKPLPEGDSKKDELEQLKQTPKQTKQESGGQMKLQMGEIKKTGGTHKKKYSSSSNSSQNSRSISRSREKKRKPADKKQISQSPRRKRSHSNDKNRSQKPVELKLVVPRKLYHDHKQLRYIEQLSNTEIITTEQVRGESTQKLDTQEGVLTIRGSIKDNNQCMRLLMKRLARYHSDKR